MSMMLGRKSKMKSNEDSVIKLIHLILNGLNSKKIEVWMYLEGKKIRSIVILKEGLVNRE